MTKKEIKNKASEILNKTDFDRNDFKFLISVYYSNSIFEYASKVGLNPTHLRDVFNGYRPLDSMTIQLMKLKLFKDLRPKKIKAS